MKIIHLLIAGFLCMACFYTPLFSQQYPLTIIDYEDGLSKSAIYEVMKDKQGYMWMASDASIIRYDGSTFKYYTVRDGFSGNFVMDIDIDAANQLWISTYGGGIARFDGNRFHAYNTSNGFPANYVRSLLFTRDGEMWAATEDMGVVRKEKGKLPQVILQKNGSAFVNPWSVIEAGNGDIWVAAVGGIGRFKKDKNYAYEVKFGAAFTLTSIAEDNAGCIWGGGAYNFVKICEDSVVNYSHLLPPGTIILDIHTGKVDNKVYLATIAGLMVFENDSMTLLDKNNGIKNAQFWDVYEDENNDVWLSSGGGGVVKYDKRGITIYDHQNDVSFESMIFDIVEDNKGRLIFGTELNGYFYFEKNSFKKFEEPAIKNIISSYATVHDKKSSTTVFTSTTGYVYWMKDGKITGVYEPAKDKVEIIYDIEFLDSTQLILLSDDGCYTITPGVASSNKIKEIPEVFCRTIFKDAEGFYWILADKGEIFKWKNGQVQSLHPLINPHNYNLSDGYYDAYHDLYWFCSNAGLIVWDGKNSLVLHSKNGLNSDMPVSITEDKHHKIWVGHDRGLTCIDVDNQSFEYVGYDQGFKTVVTNLRSILVSSEGKLWAGSVNNLYEIDIDHLKPKNKHTRLRLQEISYRDQLYYQEDYYQDSILPLNLDYNDDNLQIKLCALDYINAAGVKYSWKLKGYDKDFMPYAFSTEADYTNLPPGDYEFIAKAIDSDGYETNEVTFSMHIEKPFWEKIWFYMMEVLVFGLIVILSFVFSSRSSSNRFGQVMTFLTIIILFESLIFYVSGFINPLTNGIPVFQLVMNIILAAILQPMEQWVKKILKKTTTANDE